MNWVSGFCVSYALLGTNYIYPPTAKSIMLLQLTHQDTLRHFHQFPLGVASAFVKTDIY